MHARLRLIYLRIKRDPARFEYSDLALEPVADDEIETRELFQTEAAQAYAGNQIRLAQIRRGERV